MAKSKKAKKTCRCTCGRMTRPQRYSTLVKDPNGKRRFVRSKKPSCLGVLCKRCLRDLDQQIDTWLSSPSNVETLLRSKPRTRRV